MKEYALFLGCNIPIRYPSTEIATRKVFEDFGINLVDMKGYTCCPDPVVTRLADPEMSYVLSARNLSLAEEKGMDIMTVCNGCDETLLEANEILKKDADLRNRVNEVLSDFGREYKGTIDVKHSVEVLHEDIGISKIKDTVTPLDVKAAVHYGCHLFRTKEADEDPWTRPNMMKAVVEAVGVDLVEYGLEKLCCGYPALLPDPELALNERLLPKLKAVEKMDAKCIILSCPACMIQFESGQVKLKDAGVGRLPIIHVLELLGLSMGMTGEELHLEFHRSPALDFAKEVGG